MISVCLILRGHEPWRLRAYNYFDVGRRHDYFDAAAARRRLEQRGRLYDGPAARLLDGLLERYAGFRFSLALSSPLIDQIAAHCPRTLDAYGRLVLSGRVEPLSGTSHRCFAAAVSVRELEAQIRLGRERLGRALGRLPEVFGVEPAADPPALRALLDAQGFVGMVLPGGRQGTVDQLSGGAAAGGRLAAMLAGDLFSGGPTSPADIDGSMRSDPGSEDVLYCRTLDLESLGPSRHPDGSLELIESWVRRAASRPDWRFLTVSEAFREAHRTDVLLPAGSPARPINEMQRDATTCLTSLESRVHAHTDPALAEDFRRLTGTDQFGRMALPRLGDSEADDADEAESPYDAYIAFRHAASDLERRLTRLRPERPLSAGPPAA